eukprot:XP_001709982.1 Hypothetical protein GL50803_31956 [Giardia lamblia ATCC 50803]
MRTFWFLRSLSPGLPPLQQAQMRFLKLTSVNPTFPQCRLLRALDGFVGASDLTWGWWWICWCSLSLREGLLGISRASELRETGNSYFRFAVSCGCRAVCILTVFWDSRPGEGRLPEGSTNSVMDSDSA